VVTHSYEFTNRTTQPVRITNDMVGCRQFMSIDYPTDAIPAQGNGVVRFTVDLDGRPGPFDGHAFLFVNGDESNPIDLWLTCFVVEPVVVVPERLEFGDIMAGSSKSQTFLLRVPLSPTEQRAEVLERSTKAGPIEWELGQFADRELPPPASQHDNDSDRPRFRVSQAEVKVTISPKEPGVELEHELVLHIKDRPEPVLVKVHARIDHPRFTVHPTIINFGPIGATSVKRKVIVRGVAGSPPPVESVVEADPKSGIRARLEANPEDKKELFLWVEAEPGASRFIQGSLTLKSEIRISPSSPFPTRVICSSRGAGHPVHRACAGVAVKVLG